MMRELGYVYETARFTNNERTACEILWTHPDSEELTATPCEANEETDAQYRELLEIITVDELHELTYKYIREQNEIFQETVMAVAKERGMMYDIDEINSSTLPAIVKVIFDKFDPDEDKEKLFMLKLQLFELPEIKVSKNRELKAKLRKAKSIIEALKYACELHDPEE